MKDITLLIAHCDDELLFAWPILPRVKHIVCVSSDENNPARTWCAKRKFCLQEVGVAIGATVTCFSYDSEFYRLSTRDGQLKQMAETILTALSMIGSGPIFSHNMHGEYGNLDHVVCHLLARMAQIEFGCDLLISDITQEINWLPLPTHSWPHGQLLSRHTLDREQFDELKAIYDARGCWTWSHEPVSECSIYRV